eukprot:6213623-Pleurochrysis_carterae.AAC.1
MTRGYGSSRSGDMSSCTETGLSAVRDIGEHAGMQWLGELCMLTALSELRCSAAPPLLGGVVGPQGPLAHVSPHGGASSPGSPAGSSRIGAARAPPSCCSLRRKPRASPRSHVPWSTRGARTVHMHEEHWNQSMRQTTLTSSCNAKSMEHTARMAS